MPWVVWRIRGMATLPMKRGQGHGARLLGAILAHIKAKGGDLIWCNARVVALGYYEKFGFRREGDAFEIPGAGPHYVMRLKLGV